MMTMSGPSAQQGSDLKQAFLRHLPERIGAIEENWNNLASAGWDQPKLAPLFQRIQDLAGSAGKFGLIQVSQSVYSLEQYFKTLATGGEPPTAEQADEIRALIRGLKAVAEDAKQPVSGGGLLRPHLKRTHVYFLHLNESLAQNLVGALEALNCKIRHFKRVDDLLQAFEEQVPGGILVDAQMLPNIHPLTVLLAEKKKVGDVPPFMVLSSSSQLDTRLNAMRAGAAAFFVTPLDARTVADRIKQLATPASKKAYRIMIVDDDPSQADFAAAILRKADMETCVVTEPLQVLKTMDAFRPDLILMDLYMPDADGMELTSIIREQNEFIGIPIVFVSGEQDADKQLDALSVGGDDFIAKPIRPRHLIATIQNRVQRARALQGQTTQQSARDPVTGLFNRRHFFERLDNAIASMTPEPRAVCIMVADLDRIDELRNHIGIGQSDALLAEVGALIAELTEPQDVCARIEDSSFGILAKRPLSKNLVDLANTLVKGVAEHRFSGMQSVQQPTISVGLCYFDAAPDDAAGLLNRATMSSKLAANAGGNGIHVHDSQDEAQAGGQPRDTATLLEEALSKNGFQVLFQPFIDLKDQSSENYQMTLRLRNDQGDQLSAVEYQPIAQEKGLLLDVDRWLANRALDIIAEKRQSGTEVRLLINLSDASITDDTVKWLKDALRRRLLVGTGLILEFNLVELAQDLKRSREIIGELKSMGVAVCLGRFGHNDASYKILHFLCADYVKVMEKLLGADPRITVSLVQRVHDLNARVIVPRVDDPRQIGEQWLSGADFVQGNAIQRPQENPDYDFSEPL
jgi:diguanylate cyclase (GGDEF)-like protein